MGIFDRAGKIVGGLAEAPYDMFIGTVLDIGSHAKNELLQWSPDIDDFIGGSVMSVADRTFQAGEGIFGPDRGLGAAFGAIPEGIYIREAGQDLKTVGAGVLDTFEWTGRELIREPLATAMIAASISDSPQRGAKGNFLQRAIVGLENMADPDIWAEAHEMAQTTSVGQAVAMALGTRDILDEKEVANFVGTDEFRYVSGTVDAAMRIFADSDVLLGNAAVASRYARGVKGPTVKVIQAPQLGTYSKRMRKLGGVGIGDTTLQGIINDGFNKLPDSIKSTFFTDYVGVNNLDKVRRWEASPLLQRAAILERSADNPYALQVADSLRMQADDILTGKRATRAAQDLAEAQALLREEYFGLPLRRTAVQRLFGSEYRPSWERFNGHLEELIERSGVDEAAGVIRDRLFPNHAQGDTIAHYLAIAPDAEARESLMRVFMGDMRQLKKIEQRDYALARRLEDLKLQTATIHAEPFARWRPDDTAGLGSLFDTEIRNNAERLQRVNEEIEYFESQQMGLSRLRKAAGSVDVRQAHLSRGGQLRNRYKGSKIYQDSLFGRATRVFSENVPHSVIHVDDPKSSAQIGRVMRQAGYSDAEIARARSAYMAISEPAEKVRYLQEEIVEAAELKILRDHGIDEKHVDVIRQAAREQRNVTKEALSAGARRPRHSKFDTKGRDIVVFDDGETIQVPMLWTQVDKTIAVPDLKELSKRAERFARQTHGADWKQKLASGANLGGTAVDLTNSALNDLMKVWKVAALLRPGWTFKVVLIDEQLRMMAKFGVLPVLLGEQHRINNYLASLKERPMVRKVLLGADDTSAKGAKIRGMIYGAGIGTMVGGPIGGVAGAGLGGAILNRMWHVERAGFDNLAINGYLIDGAFGGDLGGAYRNLASASSMHEEFVGGYESALLRDLRKNKLNWRTMVWGDTEPAIYQDQWRTIINNHFRQDELARQLMEGRSVDDVIRWLDTTTEGQAYRAKMPHAWRSKPWERAEAIAAQIDDYTYSDEVRQALMALPNDAKVADYNRVLEMIPEVDRPAIHGEEVLQLMGRSPVSRFIHEFTSNTMSVLGDMPSDELSRMPMFNRVYRQEMERLTSGVRPGDVSMTQIRSWQTAAREFALTETRDLLYDLAERSEFAEMVRLLIPFFPAWQEVMTRWAGLAVENPVFAGRGMEVLGIGINDDSAMKRSGWYYEDDYGNGYLNFPIPEFAQNIVNMGFFGTAVDSQGYVRFNEDAFNLVVQGTPGFGPIAQIVASEIVEERPDLESSLQFIIPFGPVGGTVEAFLPTSVKNLAVNFGLMETRAYAYAKAQILQTRLTQMRLGERPMIDFNDRAAVEEFVKSIDDEAKKFHQFRSFAQFAAPFTPTFDTPYRPYIDAYQALRSGDYERAAEFIDMTGLPAGTEVTKQQVTEAGLEEWILGDGLQADELFLRIYGDEFFAVTQSMTKNIAGIPPTLEAWEAEKENHALVTNHPEWAQVVTGLEAGGAAQQFSRAVYNAQLAAGDRVPVTLTEQIEDYQTRLGWEHYSRFMDLYDEFKAANGITSNRDPRLEPLNARRDAVVEALRKQYPEWHIDFSTVDRSRDRRVIEGAWAITEHPGLSERQDIEGMRRWLEAREYIMGVLATRPYSTLEAQANSDLRLLWEQFETKLVETNPAFADLYHRKLERIGLNLDQMRG